MRRNTPWLFWAFVAVAVATLLLLGALLLRPSLFEAPLPPAEPLHLPAPSIAAGLDNTTLPSNRATPTIHVTPLRRPEVEDRVTAGLRVHVVDGRDGKAVPGAVVGILDARAAVDPNEWLLGTLDLLDPQSLIDRFGRAFVADEQGVAVVPAPNRHLTLCSRASGLEGLMAVRPPCSAEVTLVLRERQRLSIRAVDESGRSVGGVPVAVCARIPGPLVIARGVTDGAGRLDLADPRGLLREYGWDGDLRHSVVASIPATCAPVWLPEEGPLSEVVTITVPDLGVLSVQVLGALTPGWRLRVNPNEAGSLAYGIDPRCLSVPVHGAWTTISAIPADGSELRVTIERIDRLANPATATVLSPVRGGDRVSVTIGVGGPARLLIVPVQDARGRPLRRFKMLLESVPGVTTEGFVREVVTDHEGKLRIPILEPTKETTTLSAIAPAPWHDTSDPRQDARVDVDPPGAPEEPWVAAPLRFSEPPVLVRGRVMNELGDGFAGVKVSLTDGSRPASSKTLQASSDAEGRFAFPRSRAADVSRDSLKLTVSHPDATLDDEERKKLSIAPDLDREIQITLRRTKTLAGRIELPAGGDATQLFVVAMGRSIPVSMTGSFIVRLIPADVVSVDVQVSTTRPVAEITGVVLAPPGEITYDPRLNPLDLSRSLAVHRVVVQSYERRISRSSTVTFRGDKEEESRRVPTEGGSATFTGSWNRVFASAEAPGYLPSTPELLGGGTTVITLEPGIPFSVAIDPRHGFPTEEIWMRVGPTKAAAQDLAFETAISDLSLSGRWTGRMSKARPNFGLVAWIARGSHGGRDPRWHRVAGQCLMTPDAAVDGRWWIQVDPANMVIALAALQKADSR